MSQRIRITQYALRCLCPALALVLPVPVALTVGNAAQRPAKSTEAVPITVPDTLIVDPYITGTLASGVASGLGNFADT
jgi:hypothetical protein